MIVRSRVPDLFTAPRAGFRISKWLELHDSGLKDLKLVVPASLRAETNFPMNIPNPVPFPLWAGGCCTPANLNPRALLMTAQAEQSLPLDREVRSPRIEIQVCPLPKGGKDPGGNAFISAGRLVTFTGDPKMAMACGCGIPDPSLPTRIHVEHYLGFTQQILRWSQTVAKLVARYRAGKRTVDLAGGDDGTVECADEASFVILTYTPYLSEVDHRTGLYLKMFN